ncbi:ATPase [Carbonactinospora thermoautotrophica]|uniref:histidine kinase n=1 Tax=Carbonactinospora thermoautotrophica TaxID=1469144 RepID=A0A132N1Z9_9ACTN|nr:PAS domain-containing sensor histidine kinase [Carbonactinospora thermoautotrophica]KWW99393.1 Histidine kinase [Carbonactinospora thermoautotrophica]KWX04159.1 ATPase [Carbonactinospora thermoautotrophica]KWX10134.1 ATPase [Carbonactinospora thermoautotrophica]MCX9192484.1 ATPase [Carbonactinospora thermoautotrophica]
MNDLVRQYTSLTEPDLEWLHVLVSDWQLLADLSFADLVLWVPTKDGQGYVAVAQMRPTTGPTAYLEDLVGQFLARGKKPLLDAALDEGRIVREGDPEWRDEVPVRVESIPVRRDGRVIAVISRNTNLLTARTPSRLELTYLQTAADLAQMIAEGRFPHVGGQTDMEAAPRVGDGLLRLDRDGVVQYASPNALSAYRRLGLATDLVGTHLGDTTASLVPPQEEPVDEAISVVCSGWAPREAEVEANDAIVQLRAIPLNPGGRRIGALVLVRDVTELRRRERELVTKDATIREIHHRVKNNLQTVAALLRLQARRLGVPEARAALDEAVRRVGAIAIVHETLSQALEETVEFDEIADRMMAMVVEVTRLAGVATVQPRREGSFGVLTAEIATPLAMVLNELLQNALEHGLPEGRGSLVVTASRAAGRLRLTVEDSGRGLPAGFDVETSGNLGLQIVRTLVVGELGGQLELGPRPGGGTRAVLDIPLKA